MPIRRNYGFLRFWRRRQPGGGESAPSRIRLRFPLAVLFLVPWFALGTILLNKIDGQARSALELEARLRASASAALLDQELRSLVQSMQRSQETANQSGGAATSEDPNAPDLRVRPKALENWPTVIAPVSVEGTEASILDEKTLSVAKSTLAANTPRVMSSLGAEGRRTLDLWVPFSRDGSDRVLLQSRLPDSAFQSSMQIMGSQCKWDMIVIDPDGTVLANYGAQDIKQAAINSASAGFFNLFSEADLYAVGTSEPSSFGFRIRAMTPLAPLDNRSRRNWTSFFIVTCVLTALSLAIDRPTFLKRESKTADGQRELALSTPHRATLASAEDRVRKTGGGSPDARINRGRGLDEVRLHQALVAGGICIWEWRRPANTILWENSPATLLRQPPDAPPPSVRALLRRTFPQERRRLLHSIRIALADGRPLSIDVRLTCFDGEQRWIALRANTIRCEGSQVLGFVGTANDVTDQKRGLSRTDALLREVSHRSKNMLALILAMARLTARDAVDVKSHLKEFALRVAGLSASQDLIVAADWQSVDFARLASAEIEAVARSDASRVKISGPPLLVTPEAAQTLGMIVTELALNATAHGALSVASGEVTLQWSFPNASTVRISWRETGGPPYNVDHAKGYSLSVIERFSGQGLKLDSCITSDGENMTWTMEGPLANIGMHSTPLPGAKAPSLSGPHTET